MSRNTDKQKLKKLLYKLQDGACSICGEPIVRFVDGSLDHVIPRGAGGFHRGNRLLAHWWCNDLKADADPTNEQLQLLVDVNAQLFDERELRLIQLDIDAFYRMR